MAQSIEVGKLGLQEHEAAAHIAFGVGKWRTDQSGVGQLNPPGSNLSYSLLPTNLLKLQQSSKV